MAKRDNTTPALETSDAAALFAEARRLMDDARPRMTTEQRPPSPRQLELDTEVERTWQAYNAAERAVDYAYATCRRAEFAAGRISAESLATTLRMKALRDVNR
jgi:hypothetical protein